MIHISIEGMDGAGKSTVCKMLADKLGYRFVEKPLHFLFDEDGSYDNYISIRNKVNENPNRVFTSWFYGLGSLYLYEKFRDENIITDRHLASNYAWSGSSGNEDVYDLLIKKLGKPALTVILYCSHDALVQRLKSRNENDRDIGKAERSEEVYEKMTGFCRAHEFPHIVIDTSKMDANDVVSAILKEIGQ